MSTKKTGQKILRIGLFQNGEFIEERLIHNRGAVTIGQDFKKNTFVVPASKLPRTFTVFDKKDGKYALNFNEDMSIKLSPGDGGSKNTGELVRSGKAKKVSSGYQVPLTQRAYGRVAWGTGADEVALLFQFVTPPPPRPKPVLPASMRGGIITGIVGSLILAITCSISAVLQIGFVAFVMSRDWPKPRDIDYEMPDRFVKVMVEEEEEIETTDEKMEAPSEEEGPGEEEKEDAPAEEQPKEETPPEEQTPEERAAAEAERKRRMAEEVQQKTILGQLGAIAQDGNIVDSLSEGAGKTSMEEAFANSQGITSGAAGAEKSGLKTSGSSGADGKGQAAGIGDLKGTKGAAKAQKGVGTGSKAKEKKVRVKLKYEKEKVVGGKLDANAISRVIRRRQSAIQRCYEREVKKNPSASGKVIVGFTIGTAGRVTSSRPVSDSVGGGVGTCVANQIKRMRFPRPKGGEVIVKKTFVFEVAQ
jgi:outer membrane biosynthesis protein TonB